MGVVSDAARTVVTIITDQFSLSYIFSSSQYKHNRDECTH